MLALRAAASAGNAIFRFDIVALSAFIVVVMDVPCAGFLGVEWRNLRHAFTPFYAPLN